MAEHHFSAMNSFIKSADYLTSKPVKKRSSAGNAFGISRRKDYTSEEKLFFVNLVVEGGNSKASVAKQYDIPESTLRGWCKPKHKDKLEKEAHERKSAPNVFDTPSPSSSSSSAGSGVTSAALYHPYKDSPFDHHPAISSTSIVPTLQIPKVENLYYPQQTPLRCRTGMADPRPLIKEERDEEVLNLSNKTEHHLSSPILTQCLNSVPVSMRPEVSPSGSIKSMQHMKHALLDMKSPTNLMDIHHNMSSMFQSCSNSPHPSFASEPTCKLSPKPSNSPSPVQYSHPDKAEDVNVNKRKFDAFVSDVNKDVSSSSNTPLSLYRKEPCPVNNNSEFYKNYEQYLNKRPSDVYTSSGIGNKVEPKRDLFSSSPSGLQPKTEPPVPPQAMNHYFKNYLESMVKGQKVPGSPSNTPGGPEQFKLAAQQLWLQQLALNQFAASSMTQLPNAMQQQQTAAALQQQQLLYERQLLNSRLNQQGATPSGRPDEKLYSWTSQLHANQRELEEKLKLLIQTQQQILSDKSQSPPELPPSASLAPDTERVKRLRTMNVRDILETHRQSLEKSLNDRPARPGEESRTDEEGEDEMCVERIEEDAKEATLDLSKSDPQRTLDARHSFRTSSDMQQSRQSPLSRLPECPSPYSEPNGGRYKPDDVLSEVRYSMDASRELADGSYLDSAIHHGERFLHDLEKVSHPKLTLQHIRQVRDLLAKLRTPVAENNNLRDSLEDASCKSKRKSLLNIVHNLTN